MVWEGRAGNCSPYPDRLQCIALAGTDLGLLEPQIHHDRSLTFVNSEIEMPSACLPLKIELRGFIFAVSEGFISSLN